VISKGSRELLQLVTRSAARVRRVMRRCSCHEEENKRLQLRGEAVSRKRRMQGGEGGAHRVLL